MNERHTAMSAHLRTILPPLFLLLLTVSVFHPSLENGWTTFDDDLYVVDNPDVHGWTAQNLRAVWSRPYIGSYQPLTMMTYMADYAVGRLDASVYHATSLGVHLINVLLTYLLSFRLTQRDRSAAFVTALVFAVHPAHVEPVAWIASRKDVVSALFALSALIVYAGGSGVRRRWAVTFLFTAAVLSKGAMFVLPFLFLAVDRLQGRTDWRRAAAEKWPMFVIAGVTATGALFTQSAAGAVRTFSVHEALAVPPYALLFYLQKFAVWSGLSAVYPFPVKNGGLFPAAVYGSAPIVASLAVLVWRIRHRPMVLFGLLFFLILVAPALQAVRFSNIVAADRFTYLAYIGLTLPLAVWGSRLWREGQRWRKLLLFAAMAGWMAAAGLSAHERVGVWRDSAALWKDVLTKYPDLFR